MSPRSLIRFLAVLLAWTSGACASTGVTLRSGVGDALLEHPPWVAGMRSTPSGGRGARVGVLPIHFQPGAAQPAAFDPRWTPGSPIAGLLDDLNAALDSVTDGGGAALVRVFDVVPRQVTAPAARGVPPDVRFGCLVTLDASGDECVARGDSVLGRRQQFMQLSVGRPSADWVRWAGEVMDSAGVSHLLMLTLEVGEYLPRQRGFLGRKVVLGVGHDVPVPWLTSLETPVQVLQLTGALVGRDGRAVRIGAEGIVARRTPLLASAIGAQALLNDDDVSAARERRREELEDQPLAYRVALHVLVRELTR